MSIFLSSTTTPDLCLSLLRHKRYGRTFHWYVRIIISETLGRLVAQFENKLDYQRYK